MMLYLLFAASVGLWFVLRGLGMRYVNPGLLFLLPWILMTGLLSTNVVEYDQILSTASFSLILASLVAFAVGTTMGTSTDAPGSHQIKLRGLPVPIRRVFTIAALIYTVIYLLNLRDVLGGTTGGETMLLELREAHWEKVTSGGKSVTDIAVSVVRMFAMVAAFGTVYNLKIGDKPGFLTSVIACIGILIETFTVAGRAIPAFVILVNLHVYFNLFYRPQRRLFRKTHLALFVAGLLGVYYVFAVFPVMRNPDLPLAVDLFLSLQHSARISDWVYELSNALSLPSLPIFVYGTSYLSMPIPKCTFFLESTALADQYMLGNYNIPTFSRITSFATGEPSSWSQIREYILSSSNAAGYNGNPWATGVRDFAIDFGYLGTPVVLGIAAFFSASLATKVRRVHSFQRVIISSTICSCWFVFPFFSPFLVGPFLNAIYLLIFTAAVERIASSSRSHFTT